MQIIFIKNVMQCRDKFGAIMKGYDNGNEWSCTLLMHVQIIHHQFTSTCTSHISYTTFTLLQISEYNLF